MKTKKESKELLQRGLLGNHLRHWNTAAEIDPRIKTVTVRSNIANDKFCRYLCPIEEANQYDCVYFNETAPDEYLTAQGEFCRSWGGWNLHYSIMQAPMRIALKQQGWHVEGLRVLALLRHYCNDVSFQMLMDLIDNYDQSVNQWLAIEFSCYSVKLGCLPNHNTIIWECRAF